MEAIISKKRTLDLIYIAMFAALITVCSWIAIPPVIPFTLQTMAVFITAGLLGAKRGTAAVIVYLLLGLVGIPVFAGFTAGPTIIAGPTGGYIVGFIFMAIAIGIITKKFGKSTLVLVIAMLIGIIICYAFGTWWFLAIYLKGSSTIGLGAALASCVVPYIIPDLVKIVIAMILVKRLTPHVKD